MEEFCIDKTKAADAAAAALCAYAVSDSFWRCTEKSLAFSSLPLSLGFSLLIALTAAVFELMRQGCRARGIALTVSLSVGAVFCMLCGGTQEICLVFSVSLFVIFVLTGTGKVTDAAAEEEERYMDMEERYERSRELWHDMRSHVAVIGAYAARGDCEGMRAYTEKFCGELEKTILPYRTGNRAVDAVLGDKLYTARKHNISIELSIEPLDRLTMSGTDLCTVISNLIANAVEACLALEESERYIRIAARWNGDSCYFTVENPFSERTPGKTGKEHGIGLRNAERAVHKHGGMFAASGRKGIFRAAAELR